MRYICEGQGCGREYGTAAEALACEQQAPGKRLVEVGDIVTASSGFGWYDGDRRWVRNPDVRLKQYGKNEWKKCPNGDDNCFARCCTYGFYYVVTAIDVERHRVRYHVGTRAMLKGYRFGYTYNEHHIPLVKVKEPSSYLVHSGRGLIGRKARGLIS